jgi:2-succinyl-5-enolpyruvyl-6-hydroxy-3-cyclohexene-1-carboxylate synthase
MNFVNINHLWGTLIIDELSRLGVDYFCVAPGSRSSPLVIALAQHKKVKSFVHFDERGLGFHAMGYAAATLKPAVLICTSGTAAANFLPAVIEASKKKLPLIIITADRPPELRQTGAVQTIDQVGIYGKYTQWATDMPCPDIQIPLKFVLTTIDHAWYQALRHRGVVHINAMFREPLTLTRTKDDLKSYTVPLNDWFKSSLPYTRYVMGSGSSGLADSKEVISRLKTISSGLIVVGKISGDADRKMVLELAQKIGWPVFADISSGLRLSVDHPNLVHYFDQLLSSEKILRQLSFDGVLHLGGRITSKRYYEFIRTQKLNEYIMVQNHSLRNDPNHQVTLRVESAVADFIKILIGHIPSRKPSKAQKLLFKANRIADAAIEKFLENNDYLSEPGVARLVSVLIPKSQGLFLSNSMPIRDMDAFADFKGQAVVVNGNRGASGIDGIIASAAGFSRGLEKPVTLMIGDLAGLHDLNSLAMLRDLPFALIIVVLNNGGGGIFSFLPVVEFQEGFEKFFGMPHSFTFANTAAAFELNYYQPMDAGHFKEVYTKACKSKTSTIIEVMTSRADNLKVHQSLNRLILDRF